MKSTIIWKEHRIQVNCVPGCFHRKFFAKKRKAPSQNKKRLNECLSLDCVCVCFKGSHIAIYLSVFWRNFKTKMLRLWRCSKMRYVVLKKTIIGIIFTIRNVSVYEVARRSLKSLCKWYQPHTCLYHHSNEQSCYAVIYMMKCISVAPKVFQVTSFDCLAIDLSK